METRQVKISKWSAVAIGAVVVAAIAVGYALRRTGSPAGSDFIEYAMQEKTDIPTALAIAADGTVWFTMDSANALGKLRDGKQERVVTGKRNNVEPVGLGVDASGTVWFADALGQAIVSIAPDGKQSAFALDTPIARLGRLTVARDGAVWFAEGTAYSITRLKDGKLTRHEIKDVRGGPYGVATDAEGNAWATLQSGNQLMRIAPGGATSFFEVPTRASSPTDLTVDAQGNVWFIEFKGNKVGTFAAGKFTEYEVPGKDWAGLSGITVAPDGAVWFGLLRHHAIGRLKNGKLTIVQLPRADARPYTLAVDPSGNVWYADISGYVGMLGAAAATR
jgi:virginiamycin B lyase